MRRHRSSTASRRAGSLIPALAMAVLASFLIGALVLNVAWRRAADRQIVVAADAAALAAAAELACDERLLDGPLPESTLEATAERADELASRHRIVGTDARVPRDRIRIGRRVADEDGESIFLDTDREPTSVLVSAWRGQDGRLPWLFRAGGHSTGMLESTAEATIEGRVGVLQPRLGGTVPIWPIALRWETPASTSPGDAATASKGWRDQVEMKQGGDRFSFDRETKRIVARGDGLPELVVRSLPKGGKVDEVGITLADLGQSFQATKLDRALRDGLNVDDLGVLDGKVPVATLKTSPVDVDALPTLPLEFERNLKPGDARALFLFETLTAAGGSYDARLNGVAVARLMELEPTKDGGWQATFQPAVLATSTAVLADSSDEQSPGNRYLYKVRLTR